MLSGREVHAEYYQGEKIMGTVLLTDGSKIEGNVYVKTSGWVKIIENGDFEDGDVYHYPPRQVVRATGEVKYQSPHGRI